MPRDVHVLATRGMTGVYIHDILMTECDSPGCHPVCALSRKVNEWIMSYVCCSRASFLSKGVSGRVDMSTYLCVLPSVPTERKMNVMHITNVP